MQKEFEFVIIKDNHFIRYEFQKAVSFGAASHLIDKRLAKGEVAALVNWEYVR